jgi:hypothetical protein
VEKVKALCDKYYKNPPVSEDDILNARLQLIYVINIDSGKVIEVDVDSYMNGIEGLASITLPSLSL